MMKVFLLFSHKLTNEQEEDLRKSYHVEKFVYLPKPLQELWSNVPPEIGAYALSEYAKPFREFLQENATPGDLALVSGDFGLTCIMANISRAEGLKPIYATTKREVVEIKDGDKVIKKTQFKHIRFREF